MSATRTIRLNAEAIKRARISANLSQRALARNTDIRLGYVLSLEKGGSCERLTLAQLYKLADALSIDVAALLSDDRSTRAPEPDDVVVESALAQVGKAVNKDDLAWALGWEPGRVTDALNSLATRLETTGQRLRPHKFGWWGLSPAGGLLNETEAADLDRATLSEFGLRLSHAKVLYKLLDGKPLPRMSPVSTSGRPAAVGELLRANIVGVTDDGVLLNPDVAFSLGLEDIPVGRPSKLRPQQRSPRAVYSQNRRERSNDDVDWRKEELAQRPSMTRASKRGPKNG